MSRRTALLAGATAVAAVVQWWMLGRRGLFTDETIAITIARAPTLGAAWRDYLRLEQQPPLNNVLLGLWMRVVGFSDVAVRLPSAICTAASIPFVARAGRRLTDDQTSLVAAWLLALSPFTALFGPMGLYYGPTLVLTCVATNLVSARRWTSYSASMLALVFTNATSVGVAFGHAALVRKPRRRWVIAAAVSLIALAAWLLWDASRLGVMRQFRPDVPSTPARLALLATYPFYAFSLGQTLLPWRPVAIPAMVAIAVAIVIGARQRLRVAAAFAATLGSAFLVFAVYARDRPFDTLPSRAIGALPFFVLVVAAGLVRLRPALRILVAASIGIASIVSIVNTYAGTDYHSPILAVDTPQIMRDVRSRARPGDAIVADHDLAAERYDRGVITTGIVPPDAQRVWLIRLGRDGTRPRNISWQPSDYRLDGRWGYVRQDPTLRRLKSHIGGLGTYGHKVTVQRYVRE